MKIQINSTLGELIFEGDFSCIADAVKAAISAKKSLRSADLSYADLRSADLSSADLRSADLRSADLSYADLSYADLRSADLSYADLSYADLSYANLSYANLRTIRVCDRPIPVIKDIDQKILDAVKSGGKLEMSTWHTCETTHCRAGWAIHLAGADGYRFEGAFGAQVAGTLIYLASRPDKPSPDFHASNKEAMADMEACVAK